MNYLPGLIPTRKRVLVDYFEQESNKKTTVQRTHAIGRYLIACVFFTGAFLSFNHLLSFLLILMPGVIILPDVKLWLERRLIFSLTLKITLVLTLMFFVPGIALLKAYHDQDMEGAWAQKKLDAKRLRMEEALTIQKAHRRDSILEYIKTNQGLVLKGKYDDALKQLALALTVTTDPEEASLLVDQKVSILNVKAVNLIKKEKYALALPLLSDLIERSPTNELLYSRGLCLSQTGKVEQAIADLSKSMELGNGKAKDLYNRLNPIRKRVSYYVTRCCDGSTSNSTGRGTCSHHDGVCDWNEPVYEEYRKY